jgi:hypothetical protein
MDGLTLLEEARGAGLRVAAEGNRLVIRGPKTAEPLARRLLAHKAEVLAALAGPRHLAPTPDPGDGLSATSLASFAALGMVVSIRSRSLGATVYLVPHVEAAAGLLEAGIPRHRCYTPAELGELAAIFTLEPTQRAAALQALDAAREAFGAIEVVAVRPAASSCRREGARQEGHEADVPRGRARGSGLMAFQIRPRGIQSAGIPQWWAYVDPSMFARAALGQRTLNERSNEFLEAQIGQAIQSLGQDVAAVIKDKTGDTQTAAALATRIGGDGPGASDLALAGERPGPESTVPPDTSVEDKAEEDQE